MLAPDCVCDIQLEELVLLALKAPAPGREFPVQGVERGMKPGLGKLVVKGVHHLAFRLALGSGEGHGKGLGNAERRKEEVAFAIAQGAVQLESKGIVSLRQCPEFPGAGPV